MCHFPSLTNYSILIYKKGLFCLNQEDVSKKIGKLHKNKAPGADGLVSVSGKNYPAIFVYPANHYPVRP